MDPGREDESRIADQDAIAGEDVPDGARSTQLETMAEVQDEGDAAVVAALLAELGRRRGLRRPRYLAGGGMGLVEVAIDEVLQRRVARKVLRTRHLTDEGMVRHFLREAQVTAQLDHPGVVPVHELGIDESGRPYFTMKLVEGSTLEEWCAERRSVSTAHDSLYDLLEILVRVCQTLEFAHSRGVVHCDVKPENVIVGPFGEVYLLDWGLTRTVDASLGDDRRRVHPSVDAPGMTGVAGTPAFMAPEQALQRTIDQRTDVFGVGALLYFALAGRPPFEAESASRALALAAGGRPPKLSELAVEGTPSGLIRLAEQAMSKDPDDRPSSMAELRVELVRLMRGSELDELRVAAGTDIVREGEEGDAAYILISGRALAYRTVEGEDVPLGEMRAGEVFGEIAILASSRRTASVKALEDCVLLVVTRDVFEREIDAMKPWMGAFTRTVARRFRERELGLRSRQEPVRDEGE